MTAPRVAGLDGVRGLAILLVLVSHGLGLLTAGMIGVLVFFVLSGYLITGILVSEHRRTGRISLRAFYVRRALRLLPALLVLLALLALTPLWPALEVSGREALRGVVFGALYLTDFTLGFQLDNPQPIAHLWSLAVEEQFYLLWPITLVGLLRMPSTRRLAVVRRLIAVAVLVRLVTMAVSGPLDWFFYALPTTWADCLLLGAALALVRHDAPDLWARIERRASQPSTFAAAAAVVLGTSSVAAAFWSPVMYTIGIPVVAVAAGVLVVAAATGASAAGAGLLRTAPARWLGDHSYSLYLYNSFCVLFLQRVIGAGLPQRLLGVALAIVLAVLSRRYVERPFLRLKDRLDDRPAAAATPA
jgi:peptidoglycan/LPS O-acetylase OafA/YrhL